MEPVVRCISARSHPRSFEYMDQGLLVPDELTVGLVTDRISQPDCGNGFMLDGFPRNVSQAVQLDAFLKNNGIALDKVIKH